VGRIFKTAMALFALVSFPALPAIGMDEEYSNEEEVKKEEEEIKKEVIMEDEKTKDEKEAVKLEEMAVTATKTEEPRGNVPGSVSVVTKEDIEAANIESAADALRWVTGVRLKKGGWRGAGNPSSVTAGLLGLPSKYTLVLVNGQRVIGGGTDGGVTPQSVDLEQFPSDIIERIEVITGAGSSIYGSQAVGGVINIITKSPPKKPSVFASAEFGSRDARIYKASHGLTIDKFGYYLNYTHREVDGLDPGSEYDSDNAYARLSYDFTPSLKLTIEPRYYHQSDVFSYISPFGRGGVENYKQKSETQGINSILDWRPDESSRFKIRLSGEEYNQEKNGGGIGSPAQTYEQDNDRYEAELSYARPFFENNLITLGYQYSKEKYKYLYYKIDKDQTLNAGFIQDEINLDPFSVTLAGRVDDYNQWGTVFSPRAGLSYRVVEDLNFGVSIGKSFRAPSFRELYQDGWLMGGRIWMFGNPDLKPEKAIGYQAGVEYTYKNLLVQGSLFRNDLKDMIEWDRNYIPNYMGRGTSAWRTQNIAKAYTQGIELSLGMVFTNDLRGSLGYTFVDSENEETGTDLAYTPNHELYIELNYKESEYLPHINLRGKYVGKRYTSTDQSSREQEDDYILVDISFSKTFFKHYKAFFSIDNIFNTKYVDGGNEMPGCEVLGGVSINF